MVESYEKVFFPALSISFLLLTTACVRERSIQLEEISFADRQRLDGLALSDTQRATDRTVGTFSDGSGADGDPSVLVSELFQGNLRGRAVNNLPLADCYWLAADQRGNDGDRVELSWNTHVLLEPVDGLSSRHFGFCNARDVDTGAPVHTTGSGLEPEPFAIPIIFPDEPIDYPAIEVLGALLTAHPSTAADPDSRCPGDREFHFDGPEQHLAQDPSYLCVSRNGCEVSFCGRRCGFRPSTDMSLRLSAAFELDNGSVTIGDDVIEVGDATIVPRWMKPNLMVVRGSRRLVRPMAPVAGQLGRYSWSTPVIDGGEAGTRWHESFSSNVVVATARFLHRRADGTEGGLSDIRDNRMIVRTPSTTYECSGEPLPDGTVFDLSTGCRRDSEAFALVATPTYLVGDLREDYGYPLSAPLLWEVVFLADPLAQGGEVLLELGVRSEVGKAFLKLDPAGRDLGRRQVGTLVETRASATNVGGKTLRVTNVWLDGPAAPDFDVALPVDPRPLPLAIDVRRDEAAAVTAAAGDDWDAVPLVDLVEDESQALTLLRPSTVDGASFQLYGDGVDGAGSHLYVHDPSADFSGWQPMDDEDRPVVRTAWDLRSLPFDLSPGESFPIHLTGRPGQLGDLSLTLQVEAFDVTAPSSTLYVASVFALESITGPIPGLLPERMTLLPERPKQRFLVMNNGALPLLRGYFEIVGPDAARFQVVGQHPPTYAVEAGLAEWFEVAYDPICGYPYPSHVAELRVTTDAGLLVLDLVGISVCEP